MNAKLKLPMKHIGLLPHRFDVKPIQEELAAHPELWDEYKGRLNHPRSPHRETHDIWLRYSETNLHDKEWKELGPHKSVWYPSSEKLPLTKAFAEDMFRLSAGAEMGGILIVRVPPGKQVYPHADLAWHAKYYEKFVVQISGDPEQEFEFSDGSHLSALDGESYWIDNSIPHWVTNPSQKDWTVLTVNHRK